MNKEIKLDLPKEDELDDKRNEIAENCFMEIDIFNKTYIQSFGNDRVTEEFDLIQNNFALVLQAHKNDHNLYDIDIEKVTIPKSRFKDDNGNDVENLKDLGKGDRLIYINNLILNVKLGISELGRSGYFKNIDDSTFLMPIDNVLQLIMMKLDESILRLNVTLNNLHRNNIKK